MKIWNNSSNCYLSCKKFAWPPIKKKHLSPSSSLYLPCACACSLLDRVRLCQILPLFGRRRWFFFHFGCYFRCIFSLPLEMEEPSISSMCIVSLLTLFTISYMPSPRSSYHAFKYGVVVDSPVDYGIVVVVCIVHIAHYIYCFELWSSIT